MDLAAIIAAVVPVIGAVAEVLRRQKKKQKARDERDNDTHRVVSNHLMHAVERIEDKLDRGFADVNARIDRHVDGHA